MIRMTNTSRLFSKWYYGGPRTFACSGSLRFPSYTTSSRKASTDNVAPEANALGKFWSYPNGQQQQQQPTGSHSSDPCNNLWLLDGINPSTADFYNSNLKMDSLDDFHLLQQPNFVWDAATKDAKAFNLTTKQYVAQIDDAMTKYQISDQVHDRKSIYNFLKLIQDQDGQLLLVLGGKSIGKSLVIHDYCKSLTEQYKAYGNEKEENDGNNREKNKEDKEQDIDKKLILPFLVDGRSYAGKPLSFFIKRAYEHLFHVNKVGLEFPKYMTSPVDIVQELLKRTDSFPDETPLDFSTSRTIVNLLQDKELGHEGEALESFVEFAEAAGFFPVLFVDEANKVLGFGAGSKSDSSILQSIVKFTKQENRMAVVLVSTDSMFPYHLERSGFNLQDIREQLFVGEMSPKSMWQLLVDQEEQQQEGPTKKVIGMGPNLAKVLMSAYGGHFLWMERAVSMLLEKKEDFTLDRCLNPISQSILDCLKVDDKEKKQKALYLFRQMAKSGFAPIDGYMDKTVQRILKSNIGDLVSMEGSTFDGLPNSVWHERSESFGLIPISQSARLVMAKKVFEENSANTTK